MTTVSTYAQAPSVGAGANGHQGIEVGPDGALWATLNAVGAAVGLYRIDPATHAYSMRAAFNAPEVFALAPGGVYWVVDDVADGEFYRTSVASGAKTLMPRTTSKPVAPAFQPSTGALYYATYDSGEIVRRPAYMSAAGETVIASGLTQLEDLFFSADGHLWACRYGPAVSPRVYELNATTGAVLHSWTGPAGPEGAAELLGKIYIASRPDSSVWVIDRATNTISMLTGMAGVGYQDGDASIAKFAYASVIASDEGRLYVGEISPSRRMRQIDLSDSAGWTIDLVMP